MRFTVNVKPVTTALEQFQEDLESEVDRVLIRAGKTLKSEIAQTRAFGGDKLRRAVDIKRLPGDAIRGEMPQVARWLNDGTRAHIIRARNKKALFFYNREGEPIITQQVRHPGTKATHFAEKALEATGKDVENDMRESLERITNKFNQK